MAAVLAGCGGGTSPDVTAAASQQLSTDVARLQTAAATHDATAVDRAASTLRSHVVAQQQAGHVSSARASAILAQLTNVLADTTTAVHAPSASPAAKPAPPAAPNPDGKHKKGKDDGGGGGH